MSGVLSFRNQLAISPLSAFSCKYERPGASPKRSHDGEYTAVPSKCPVLVFPCILWSYTFFPLLWSSAAPLRAERRLVAAHLWQINNLEDCKQVNSVSAAASQLQCAAVQWLFPEEFVPPFSVV